MDVTIKYNKMYDEAKVPAVTIVTSVYNRREILRRAMDSVAAQTFRDIEYIVVDNGSSIDIDDVVEDFMATASIPVVYIKRSEGIGPHTGKNSALREARGKYLMMLDSDDELLPNAAEVLYNTWIEIPEDVRDSYREVVARCVDEYGKEIGSQFPPELNSTSKKRAFRMWNQPGLAVEHVEMNRTKYLKDLMFPEPEGVTWVVDSVALWNRLSKKYKSYFINDCLKRYYIGSEDSINNTQIKKMTIQHCINMLWANKFSLSHWDEYCYGFTFRIKTVVKYNVFRSILKITRRVPDYDWLHTTRIGLINTLLSVVLYVPSYLIAKKYIKNKMQL